MIRAVTFDFWDTIVHDDSDEPKRAALGLESKAQARFQALVQEIQEHHPDVSDERIKQAFDQANDWFRICWKEHHHTPKVRDRLAAVYRHLHLPHTPGLDNVVTTWERMEIITPPDLAEGVGNMLAELSKTYALGIISDTVVTPGWGLQQLLQNYGLLQYFRVFIFSDEIGASKPSRTVFAEASRRFALPFSSITHVGDRETNDVTGPQQVGMSSILYTGVINRGHQNSQADGICHHYREMPALLASLHQR